MPKPDQTFVITKRIFIFRSKSSETERNNEKIMSCNHFLRKNFSFSQFEQKIENISHLNSLLVSDSFSFFTRISFFSINSRESYLQFSKNISKSNDCSSIVLIPDFPLPLIQFESICTAANPNNNHLYCFC